MTDFHFIFIHKIFCLLAIPPAPNWAVFSAEYSAVIDFLRTTAWSWKKWRSNWSSAKMCYL